MPKKDANKNRILALCLLIIAIAVVLLLLKISKKDNIATKEAVNVSESLMQAAASYDKGKFLDAIMQYRKIIEADPKNYGAYIGLGHSYLRLGIYDESIRTFEKTKSIGYQDYRTYYGLGLVYYQMENYNNAYSNFKQAYVLNPNNKAVVSYLINVYNALGLYDEAINLAKSRLETDPKNSHYYRKMAISYFLKNELSASLQNSLKSVEINGNYAPNHLTLANIYLGLGQTNGSLREFKAALKLVHGNAVYEGLSAYYALLNDSRNSEKNAKLATGYPEESFSLSLLGFALLDLNQHQPAIQKFEEAAKNTPDYYLPYKGMGKTYMSLGQKGKAKEYLKKAAELNPLDIESKELINKL